MRSFDEAIFQSSRLRPVRPQHPECDIPTDPNRTSDHATLSRTLSGTGSEARDARDARDGSYSFSQHRQGTCSHHPMKCV